jgi:hypothetical protein
MVDAALSAFSVFFTPSPSFLAYQRSLEQAQGNNNARTLFDVHNIPSDNPIRSLLDATPPGTLKPVYAFLFNALEQAGVVDSCRSFNGTLLLALDGTGYFSSQALHCGCGSSRTHANGQVTPCHTALTPVLVKSGGDKGIALAPEFVTPQDGAAKQDCEINAAKRWLAAHGAALARLKTTVLGEDPYCHEPFGRELLAQGLDFILVCKPSSHATVFEWLAHLARNGAVHTVTRTRWTGRRRETDTYRYAHAIPWRDADDALAVNGCELVTTNDSGKVWYRNAFATSLALDDGNVAEVVAAGRRRWQIENENNNTLKTQGYHFAHHFGHGRQHLSTLLASLIILAFLTHTVLEWMDDQYRLLRQQLSSRRRLFNDIRT